MEIYCIEYNYFVLLLWTKERFRSRVFFNFSEIFESCNEPRLANFLDRVDSRQFVNAWLIDRTTAVSGTEATVEKWHPDRAVLSKYSFVLGNRTVHFQDITRNPWSLGEFDLLKNRVYNGTHDFAVDELPLYAIFVCQHDTLFRQFHPREQTTCYCCASREPNQIVAVWTKDVYYASKHRALERFFRQNSSLDFNSADLIALIGEHPFIEAAIFNRKTAYTVFHKESRYHIARKDNDAAWSVEEFFELEELVKTEPELPRELAKYEVWLYKDNAISPTLSYRNGQLIRLRDRTIASVYVFNSREQSIAVFSSEPFSPMQHQLIGKKIAQRQLTSETAVEAFHRELNQCCDFVCLIYSLVKSLDVIFRSVPDLPLPGIYQTGLGYLSFVFHPMRRRAFDWRTQQDFADTLLRIARHRWEDFLRKTIDAKLQHKIANASPLLSDGILHIFHHDSLLHELKLKPDKSDENNAIKNNVMYSWIDDSASMILVVCLNEGFNSQSYYTLEAKVKEALGLQFLNEKYMKKLGFEWLGKINLKIWRMDLFDLEDERLIGSFENPNASPHQTVYHVPCSAWHFFLHCEDMRPWRPREFEKIRNQVIQLAQELDKDAFTAGLHYFTTFGRVRVFNSDGSLLLHNLAAQPNIAACTLNLERPISLQIAFDPYEEALDLLL